MMEESINNIPGVLENGLFVDLVNQVLVGEVTNGIVNVKSLEKNWNFLLLLTLHD